MFVSAAPRAVTPSARSCRLRGRRVLHDAASCGRWNRRAGPARSASVLRTRAPCSTKRAGLKNHEPRETYGARRATVPAASMQLTRRSVTQSSGAAGTTRSRSAAAIIGTRA